MYCSLRFYIEGTPDLSKTQNILGIFELFSNVLGKSYDYIQYTIFDPDSENTLVDEKFLYDFHGKTRFLCTDILPSYTGKSGDLSSPFITATCNEKATQIYSVLRIQIQFPIYVSPFIIRVDYDAKFANNITLQKYVYLIQSLHAMGFQVNNCFYHVYSNKHEATTLDGGYVGSLLNCYGRLNIKNSVLHSRAGFLNRFMDIFCINSISLDLLAQATREEVENIVGRNNTMIVDGIFSFALGNTNKLTPIYRIKYYLRLKRLRRMLL